MWHCECMRMEKWRAPPRSFLSVAGEQHPSWTIICPIKAPSVFEPCRKLSAVACAQITSVSTPLQVSSSQRGLSAPKQSYMQTAHVWKTAVDVSNWLHFSSATRLRWLQTLTGLDIRLQCTTRNWGSLLPKKKYIRNLCNLYEANKNKNFGLFHLEYPERNKFSSIFRILITFLVYSNY